MSIPLTLDALVGNADAFPILPRWDYFNHAGISPLPAMVRDAVKEALDVETVDTPGIAEFFKKIETLRQGCADLVNADASEIALMKNTSEGVSLVALGLNWKPGERIVTTAAEYPANVYPWMAAAERFGLELVRVEEQTDDSGRRFVPVEQILSEVEKPNTRLLAISHVQYASGQCFDLAQFGQFCRERGVLFSVDVIQSAGVVPIDVKAQQIDFLQTGSHKWLLAPTGGGFAYIRRELIEQVKPTTVGWWNMVDPFAWENIDFTWREGAGRYEYGTIPLPTIIGLDRSVSLLREVGIDAIHRRVRSLGDRFVSGIDAGRFRLLTPRDGEHVGGAICFEPVNGDPAELVKTLREQHRIELAARAGRMRFAPHFYNTDEQIDRLVTTLNAL